MKLLCFPYAGASSRTFLKWEKYFDGVEIIPVDLPGRGRRMAEPLCKTIEEMVDDIKKQMPKVIDQEEEYAVYGHSMGSLLINELLHDLPVMKLPMPVHIFISGKNPPHIPVEDPIYQFNDAEFIERIVRMGGMDAQTFENPVLAKVFLPILKTDFTIVENYYRPEKKKQQFPVDISYFFASDDTCLNRQFVKQWADFTSGSFRMYYFTGGHFFLFEQGEQIAKIIEETLSSFYDVVPY
jgi:surfactin synthase thioesterase subunit